MDKKYKCEVCGKTSLSDKKAPKCCGKPMKHLPIDICVQPSHAEHTRPMKDEDACNDGRAGY